ncbi:serine protease (plasmid) [Pantoea agglomerans]|uniref:trypsin-like serine peptidase n=1 Tax=Enterobacter agglomerans TaxID=549 RepID=UPI0017808426|nr:serine protease [Pantoea agglomerans]WVL92420.1 serine protease [Pantoea agglomerans]
MTIEISSDGKKLKEINLKNILSYENLRIDLTAELKSGGRIKVSLDDEKNCSFKFTDICLPKDSVLIMYSTDCRCVETLKNIDCTGKIKRTRLMKGQSFIIQFIFRRQSSEFTLCLESLYFGNQSGIFSEREFDENGRFTQTGLKKFDRETYCWTMMSAQVFREGARYEGATAWLLSKSKYIVTNWHVAYKRLVNDDGRYTGWTLFLVDPENISKALCIQPGGKLIVIGKQPDDPFDPDNAHNQDYAILSLDEFDYEHSRVSDLTGGLGLNRDDENLHLNETVFMAGFPQGHDSQQLTSYFSPSDSHLRCTLKSTINQQVRHNCYAEGGNSGSPIISARTKNVLGLLWGTALSLDPNNIFRGVKASHIWSSVKDHLEKGEYGSLKGISADYDVFPAQLLINKDEEWHVLQEFKDNIIFSEFSGTLVHLENYSSLHVKAMDSLDSRIIKFKLRLALRTEKGMFNVSDESNISENPRTLMISYNKQDNTTSDLLSGLYHMWCGLEGHFIESGTIHNYSITSVDVIV